MVGLPGRLAPGKLLLPLTGLLVEYPFLQPQLSLPLLIPRLVVEQGQLMRGVELPYSLFVYPYLMKELLLIAPLVLLSLFCQPVLIYFPPAYVLFIQALLPQKLSAPLALRHLELRLPAHLLFIEVCLL